MNNEEKRSRTSATIAELESKGVDLAGDFHALSSELASFLQGKARYCGYRAPKGASGNRARYFFYYLNRFNNRD